MLPLPEYLVGYLSAFLQIGVLTLDLLLLVAVRTSLRQPRFDAWTLGLAGYAGGILTLIIGSLGEPSTGYAPFTTAVYMALESAGVACFIAAARAAGGLRPWPRRLTGPILAYGLAAFAVEPLALPFMTRYTTHATWLAGLFACVAVAAWRARRRRPGIGMPMVAAVSLMLTADYGQYLGAIAFHVTLGARYLAIESYVTMLLDIILGVGLLLCATDRAQERLRDIAVTDPLSGLRNRTAFTELLAAPPPDGAVAMIDLDRLKEINDRYGHRSGDRAIASVGAAVGRVALSAEYAFRIGGDEFALVAPKSGSADLERRARRRGGGTRRNDRSRARHGRPDRHHLGHRAIRCGTPVRPRDARGRRAALRSQTEPHDGADRLGSRDGRTMLLGRGGGGVNVGIALVVAQQQQHGPAEDRVAARLVELRDVQFAQTFGGEAVEPVLGEKRSRIVEQRAPCRSIDLQLEEHVVEVERGGLDPLVVPVDVALEGIRLARAHRAAPAGCGTSNCMTACPWCQIG